jgi:hypothetical protein
MPDLTFRVEGAEPERVAAEPLLLFKLRVTEAAAATPVHALVLRCQVRIEPARRRYSAEEQGRLLDLFGTPERWGQTLRPMLWTHVSVALPSFAGGCSADLPVPCSYDFSLAATKYFAALEGGEIPLCFLFSGTMFYQGPGGALQVAQVPWDREANFRLPAATWQALMDLYYPNSAWLCLRKDVFDRLAQYKSREGLPNWEQTLERLLSAAEGQRDTMLASPIILYDYPQVAPESPGDFFDGTEIDEMLTLRILTLTDEEKRAMLAVDERAGALLARTEALAREQLLGLHGTVRGLRPAPGEGSHG